MKSIKTKIIFSTSFLLLIIAVVIIGTSYLFVKTEVATIEEKANSNILNLLYLFTEAKYDQLLSAKEGTAKAIKEQGKYLTIFGHDVLSSFYTLQLKGQLTEAAAKDAALKMISRTDFDNAALAVVNESGEVIATGDKNMQGRKLPITNQLKHAKTEPLSVIIPAGDSQISLNIVFHPGWQLWTVSMIDMSVIDLQEERQRRGIVDALKKTFSHLTIAKTGYAFLTESGNPIINKPGIGFVQKKEFPSLKWTLGVTAPLSEIQAPAKQLALWQGMIIAGGFLIAISVIAFLIAKIAKPIIRLSEYAKELPNQDFLSEQKADNPLKPLEALNDEVGRLAESLSFMESQLRVNIAKLVSVEGELNVAREIQMGFLQTDFPEHEKFDLFAVCQPAKAVGGDLYDFFFVDDNRLCFALGDVSDKGVPAALFMTTTKTLIQVLIRRNPDPAEIMTELNNIISERNERGMFVTLIIGILDLTTGIITYSNGGHNPPLTGNGKLSFLEQKSGPFVGTFPEVQYKSLEHRLERGDILFLYTDGVTEALNSEPAEYSDERLFQFLSDNSKGSVKTTVGKVLNDVKLFVGNAPQSDDITMLGIRLR